jgi:hypothetical protein
MATPSYTSPPGELMCRSMFGAAISFRSLMNFEAAIPSSHHGAYPMTSKISM